MSPLLQPAVLPGAYANGSTPSLAVVPLAIPVPKDESAPTIFGLPLKYVS